jgi:3-phenylpropionate/trans-cinnamate dioxygenase ferredoxin reductase subunit
MTNYQHLIIGGGMTAAAAVDGIRQVDSTGGIGLISAELDAPYDRPPLSKALWKGQPLDSIWRKTGNKGVTVHLGLVVKEIIPKQKRVVDDKGAVFTYQKLLLATGGKPRRLAFGDDQIMYFRTLPITGVFAHSPKRVSGLPSSVEGSSVRRSLRRWL